MVITIITIFSKTSTDRSTQQRYYTIEQIEKASQLHTGEEDESDNL